MAPMKRPTQRDIAELAGVSHVTVSLALRNHPSIPEKTRKAIKKIAQRIGYRPDPALSSLIAYRHESVRAKYHATLAWIDFQDDPTPMTFNRLLFQGAKKRAGELGYELEMFSPAKMGIGFSRLSKILYARNIQGVLLGPQARKIAHINLKSFAWDQFSCIAYGFSLISPKLDVVIDAQSRSARLAVRKLKALGYRHIGYVSSLEMDERTDGNFLAGYLSEQRRLPKKNQIPPLMVHHDQNSARKQQCRKWYLRYKPDAVLDTDYIFAYDVLTPEELRRCAIATIGLPWNRDFFAGIDQKVPLIGHVGVDEVVALIQTNRRGIPMVPRRILVEGCWVDGPSAPRITH